MNILVACEMSGRVRDAFRARGHDAWSCDVVPCEPSSKFHLRMDVLSDGVWSHREWDMAIAHPPCTYLCNSGVRWLDGDSRRWELLDEGAKFFK